MASNKKMTDFFAKPTAQINKLVLSAEFLPAADEESSFKPDYYVYTDGSCANNGKENAMAGIGIYFGKNDPRNVSERLTGKQSNNIAELAAIFHLYEIIEKDITSGKKIAIVSDSTYAIGCVTTYGEKCQKGGWLKEIPNKDLVKRTYDLYKDKSTIKFIHVPAHTEKSDIHSIGNDGADKLANKAIGLDECPYNIVSVKLFVDVPFARKDEAKAMGAKWDSLVKKWYILSNDKNKGDVLSKFKEVK